MRKRHKKKIWKRVKKELEKDFFAFEDVNEKHYMIYSDYEFRYRNGEK